MQTFSSSTYELSVYASEGAQAIFKCDAADGYTDEFMIAFARAVKALAWPAGQTPTLSLSKTLREDDYYTANVNVVAPVFS